MLIFSLEKWKLVSCLIFLFWLISKMLLLFDNECISDECSSRWTTEHTGHNFHYFFFQICVFFVLWNQSFWQNIQRLGLPTSWWTQISIVSIHFIVIIFWIVYNIQSNNTILTIIFIPNILKIFPLFFNYCLSCEIKFPYFSSNIFTFF